MLKQILFNALYLSINKFFCHVTVGIDKVCEVKLYKNGFCFSPCHVGTILKKYDVCYSFFPYNKQVVTY